MSDQKAMAAEVVRSVREFVARAVDPLLFEIADLKRQIAEFPKPKDGEPGKDGRDGKDADVSVLDEIKAMAGHAVEQADTIAKLFHELPAPKDGEPGRDGKDADPEVMALMVSNAVAAIDVQAGPPGEKGKDGAPGKDGADAVAPSLLINDAGELVAVYDDGETKTVGMVRGKDGIRGASIMDGSVDDSGQLVLRMSDGRIINAGAVRGKDGADAVGKPGLPGRDADEIRILPAIDESKSYPEGTTALYRGGMIRAERTTDPISGDLAAAGWRVALEGIADESEQELDDGRIIERTTVYTSGRTFIRQRSSRALIYRGTWKDGEFARGDTVTWDGSLWHCERETKARPGGLDNNGDWKLCAKRGAPGKDGQTVKGDPGPPGRPGRDLTQMSFDGGKH